MPFTVYIGNWAGVSKQVVSGLPSDAPALQSVTSIDASKLRVVFTHNMDFGLYLLDPGNYVYSRVIGVETFFYPVFAAVQYDAQTVDLLVPTIITDKRPTAVAHLKVVDGRDTRGVVLDAVLNETDVTVPTIDWGGNPRSLVALLGSYQGLDLEGQPGSWIGSSAALLLTDDEADL